MKPWVRVGVGFAVVYGGALLLLRHWNRETNGLGAHRGEVDTDFVLEMQEDPERAKDYLKLAKKSVATAQKIVADGRGFGHKAYLSDVAAELGIPMKHLASMILNWNALGWVGLSRADLVRAMDPKKIDDSEINSRESSFHFLDAIDPEEGRRREREAAARLRAAPKRRIPR